MSLGRELFYFFSDRIITMQCNVLALMPHKKRCNCWLNGIHVSLSGGLQNDSAALYLFSCHQLLLDPGRGSVPAQSHLHGLPIR